MFGRRSRIEIKSGAQLESMRRAGLVVARTLERVAAEVAPGVTTGDLNRVAAESIRAHGATSNFLGYYGFTGVICASVNDEVVHGIPGDRVLCDGDLISIDCGAIVDGWHGDAAITVPVGAVEQGSLDLSEVTRASLWAGIGAARVGGRLSDISNAVERSVRQAGPYGILEDFVGHGIGTAMHMEPSVPNYGPAGRGPKLVAGMALAIEPMVTAGSPDVHTLEDEWTVCTDDGSWASHWEHSVAITDEGPWVLTALDGGAEMLAALGVPSPAASRG